ncbi:MAG: hypothetical protein PHT69_10020 [Bacteroidales bacterium]|nr:hypothetical protein [Bacteroidales bacterium]
MPVENLIQGRDFILLPIYLLLVFIIANSRKNKKIGESPIYRFYLGGLFARITAGILFCFLYVYNYGGGDTTDYYISALANYNLAFYNFGRFVHVLYYGTENGSIYHFYNYSIGTPLFYMMNDVETFFVVRFATPIVFLSAKSFIVATMFMAWFTHVGVWRLLMVFYHYFPKYEKQLVLGIIFFPSILFWGSGIAKDSITLAATCWYTYSFFMIFIQKKKFFKNIIIIVISSWLILSIKPFIFIALMPGSIIWLMFSRIKNIQNQVVKILLTPVLIIVFSVLAAFLMSQMSSSFGDYSSLDKILEKAVVTQQDLVRSEAYGTGFYDIGAFEPTLSGILPKFPVAVNAGLFRPYIWETTNIFQIVAGLENFFLIILVLYCLIRVGFFKFFNIIFGEPLLLFSFVFSIFFAFSVGLTSANFGALVRYKIPLLPFFVATLVVTLKKVQIIFEEQKEEKAKKEAKV